MSEPKCRQITILFCKPGETVDDNGELVEKKVASFADENEICIICHIARSGSEMDNSRCSWGNGAKGMYVRHHIVASFFLLGCCESELVFIEILCARWRGMRMWSFEMHA